MEKAYVIIDPVARLRNWNCKKDEFVVQNIVPADNQVEKAHAAYPVSTFCAPSAINNIQADRQTS